MPTTTNTIKMLKNGFKPLAFIVSSIFVFLLCCFIFSSQLHAEPADKKILIIYQKAQGYSQQLIDNLQKNFSEKGFHSQQMTLASKNKIGALELLKIKKSTLLISIGSQSTRLLLDENIKTPILSALIPRHIFKSLQKKHPHKKNWSSLLINQPINRQFHLISAILGDHKKAAILLGPYTKDLRRTLNKASSNTSHRIDIKEIQNSDQLASSLSILNHSVDVLLTLPDPVVYNKNTIREILLSAYRNKLPIIGFSRSYVKAGAIAAIYSKPEQISQQINNIVKSYFKNNSFKNKYYYPNQFSVALNKNIARSLGIKLAPNNVIINQIILAEKNL